MDTPCLQASILAKQTLIAFATAAAPPNGVEGVIYENDVVDFHVIMQVDVMFTIVNITL